MLFKKPTRPFNTPLSKFSASLLSNHERLYAFEGPAFPLLKLSDCFLSAIIGGEFEGGLAPLQFADVAAHILCQRIFVNLQSFQIHLDLGYRGLPKPSLEQFTKLGLGNFHSSSRFDLGEFPATDEFINLECQLGFSKHSFGVLHPDVGIDVGHFSGDFLCLAWL